MVIVQKVIYKIVYNKRIMADVIKIVEFMAESEEQQLDEYLRLIL